MILCEGKRDCRGQGEEGEIEVLGESGASPLGVALEQSVAVGGLESGKQPNHQKLFQAIRKRKGLTWEWIYFYRIGIISSTIQGLRGTGTGKSAPSLSVHQALPNTCPHVRPRDTHKLLSGDSQTLPGPRNTWDGQGEGL